MTPAQAILSRCIDYAGMFPPAGLDLETAVQNYAAYLSGRDAWALGMFVLPLQDLEYFTGRWPHFACSWNVSAVLRGGLSEQMEFVRKGLPPCVVAIECGPVPLQGVGELRGAMPEDRTLYTEVDLATRLEDAVQAIASMGARAKVRTGGTTLGATPPGASVARFIFSCVLQRLKFKATAGLHHAICGEHALGYEPDSDRGQSHGFLNVLLASTLLAQGGDVPTATALLQESSLVSLEFSTTAIRWRDRSFRVQQLSMMRRNVMSSFGSCSFTEPIEELRTAGIIP